MRIAVKLSVILIVLIVHCQVRRARLEEADLPISPGGQLVDHRPAISRLLTGYKPAYNPNPNPSRLVAGL